MLTVASMLRRKGFSAIGLSNSFLLFRDLAMLRTSSSNLSVPRTFQEVFSRKHLIEMVNLGLDYVGFIKKIMKLMQLSFPMFRKIEVELTQEKEIDNIPDRPSKLSCKLELLPGQ